MMVMRDKTNGRYVSTSTLEERFWEKIDKRSDDECWEWMASCNKYGYGQLWFGNTFISSHRVSWMIHFGDIPEKLCVLHKCDNRKCANPNHLFLGTYQDNSDDMKSKGRSLNQHGDNNHAAKITSEDVLRMREMWKSGKCRQKEIMKIFNISRVELWRIISYRNWKDVP